MNLQTPRILWLGLLSSTFMFMVVGFVGAPQDLELDPTMLYVFAGLGVMEVVMSFLLPAHIRRRSYLDAKFAVEEVPDAKAEAMFRDSPPMIRQFAEPEKVRARLGALSWTAFIIELAMGDAVAVFGLVLAMLGGDPMEWLPFMVVGALLIAIRFPTEARFVKALERVYDARMP